MTHYAKKNVQRELEPECQQVDDFGAFDEREKKAHLSFVANGGVFQGLRSGTRSEEWSGTGIMEPVRPNGRKAGLRFQPDGG